MRKSIAAWDGGRYCGENNRNTNLPDRAPIMSDTPPDRLSSDPKSPFYDEALLERGVGVRFNGVDRNNVEEYCVSEGWERLAVGRTVDRHGNAMTVKYKGVVEPYLRIAE